MSRWTSFVLLLFLLTACNAPTPLPSATPTPPPTAADTPTPSFTPLPTDTLTPLPSLTPTATLIPTDTLTPTITFTPTITLTPTYDFPKVTVNTQAHCRYGPASAFLHAADLYPGDKGIVGGRYQFSNWLYVKWDKINYWCWVSPSVVDISGDIKLLAFQQVRLPGPSVLYNPPAWVRAVRKGSEVTVSWAYVAMTEDDDRGYLLDVFICQNGSYIWSPVHTANQSATTYTFTDEAGCNQKSGGVVYAVEKHGYIMPPLTIDWPSP